VVGVLVGGFVGHLPSSLLECQYLSRVDGIAIACDDVKAAAR
jgi:hypothetical protein